MTKELSLRERRRLIDDLEIEGRSYLEAVDKAGGAVALVNRMQLIAKLAGRAQRVNWEKLYEEAIADDAKMGSIEIQ